MDINIVSSVFVNNQIVVNLNQSDVLISFNVEYPESKLITFARKRSESLKLPKTSFEINWLFNTKIVAPPTEKDIFLKPLIRVLKGKRDLHTTNFGTYFNQYYKDFHTSNGLLFMDNKLVVSFRDSGAVIKNTPQNIPEQFGMKYLFEYVWWPHINRLIWYHGTNCSNCIKAGKILNPLMPYSEVKSLPVLSGLNEEVNLDFASPLDINWGSHKKNFTLYRQFF